MPLPGYIGPNKLELVVEELLEEVVRLLYKADLPPASRIALVNGIRALGEGYK